MSHSYNSIKQYTNRPCGRSSIIINNNIHHSEIMLYSHMPYHNNTTIIKQTHDDKDAVINDARRKMQEDFFNKIFTSHFICKFRKGCSKFVCERELETEHNWNILTPKLWPSASCLSRSPWLLNRNPGVHPAGCWLSFLVYSPSNSTRLYSTDLCSIRRPYIIFKLPRGDMDTPPRFRNFFRCLAIGMCHFRFLWNGLCDRHRAKTTVMQFRGHSLSVRQSMRV